MINSIMKNAPETKTVSSVSILWGDEMEQKIQFPFSIVAHKFTWRRKKTLIIKSNYITYTCSLKSALKIYFNSLSIKKLNVFHSYCMCLSTIHTIMYEIYWIFNMLHFIPALFPQNEKIHKKETKLRVFSFCCSTFEWKLVKLKMFDVKTTRSKKAWWEN